MRFLRDESLAIIIRSENADLFFARRTNRRDTALHIFLTLEVEL
jgi:hypothetical protein